MIDNLLAKNFKIKCSEPSKFRIFGTIIGMCERFLLTRYENVKQISSKQNTFSLDFHYVFSFSALSISSL